MAKSKKGKRVVGKCGGIRRIGGILRSGAVSRKHARWFESMFDTLFDATFHSAGNVAYWNKLSKLNARSGFEVPYSDNEAVRALQDDLTDYVGSLLHDERTLLEQASMLAKLSKKIDKFERRYHKLNNG